MAVEINHTSIYTVKYLDESGVAQFVTIPAAGAGGAKDTFAKDYPNCTLLDVTRRQ